MFPSNCCVRCLGHRPWVLTEPALLGSPVEFPSYYSQLHHLEKGPRKFIGKQMWHMWCFCLDVFLALALRPTSSSRCGQGPSCIPGLSFFEVVIDPPWSASVGHQVDSRNHIPCLSLADVCWYYMSWDDESSTFRQPICSARIMGAVAYGSQILSEPQYSRSEPYQTVFDQLMIWQTTTISS